MDLLGRTIMIILNSHEVGRPVKEPRNAAARKSTYYFTAMAFLLSCFIVSGSAAAPAFAEDNATDWNNKAVGLSQAGKYEEAIAAFDKAISLLAPTERFRGICLV